MQDRAKQILNAFDGVLGLLEGDAGDQLVYGYDGYVDNTVEIPTLTPEERKEIARCMIARWAKWANVEPASLTVDQIDTIQRIGRDEKARSTSISLDVLDALCETARRGARQP